MQTSSLRQHSFVENLWQFLPEEPKHGRPSHAANSVEQTNFDYDGCGCCSVSSVSSDLLDEADDWSLSLSCSSLPGPAQQELQQTSAISPPTVVETHNNSRISRRSKDAALLYRKQKQMMSEATVVSRDTAMLANDDDDVSTNSEMSIDSSTLSLETSESLMEGEHRLVTLPPDFYLTIFQCDEGKRTIDGLPNDCLGYLTEFLSIQDLCKLGQTSRRAHDVCWCNEVIWRKRCEVLWKDKAFVPPIAQKLRQQGQAMEAYRFSLEDAKRQSLHDDELIYDPIEKTGTVWDFRFKETAGSDWTDMDPWWTGGKARKLVFLKDGTVRQLANGNGIRTLVPPFPSLAAARNGADVSVRWRYVSQPIDLPERQKGSYIRLTVDGRDVPTYLAHRSHSNDWSFILESCWGAFSSAEFVPRLDASHQQHDRQPRMRLRRTSVGARWLNVDGIESEDEDDDATMEVASRLYLANQNRVQDDQSFDVSTTTLWREALLYNNGATSLPDGANATAEFDRLWRQGNNPARVS